MPYQNINVTISPADVQAFKDSFAAVLAKLPFLVNLTANERKALLKTGPNSLSFVQNASSAAQLTCRLTTYSTGARIGWL